MQTPNEVSGDAHAAWAPLVRAAGSDLPWRIAVQRIFGLQTGAPHGAEVTLRPVGEAGEGATPEAFRSALPTDSLRARLDFEVAVAGHRAAHAGSDDVSAALRMGMWVNASAATLTGGYAERLLAFLDREGRDPSTVVVELTEDAPLGGALLGMGVLRDAGVLLALDDFGAGISRTEAAMSGMFSWLKGDGNLIRRAAGDSMAREWLAEAIRFAHGLGMGFVAEGIQTPAHRDVARDLGADLGQGFALATPVIIG